MALEKITVRGTAEEGEDGGTRIGLWERDPEHPGKEVLVVGSDPVVVARTPAVDAAIALRQIEQVGEVMQAARGGPDVGDDAGRGSDASGRGSDRGPDAPGPGPSTQKR